MSRLNLYYLKSNKCTANRFVCGYLSKSRKAIIEQQKTNKKLITSVRKLHQIQQQQQN